MKKLRLPFVPCCAVLLLTQSALAVEYYVAVDGDDGNPGTEAEPFASVGRGQQAAAPGDTVWVRGGTYAFSSGTVGVAFTKAGLPDFMALFKAASRSSCRETSSPCAPIAAATAP